MRDRPALIFLHIPKTAGTTLCLLLDRYYPADRAYRLHLHGETQRLHHLRALPSEQRSRLLLVHGHQPFGLHREFDRDFGYVTLLRRPIERLRSHYSQIVRRETHPLHESTWGVSMDAFLESGVLRTADNGQTRALAGADDIEFGTCTREHLRQAKHNLERFVAYGLTERFDEFALRVHRLVGEKGYPFFLRQNVDRRSVWRARASARTARLLEQLNELDTELYAWAGDRLAEARPRAPLSERFEALGFAAASRSFRWIGEPAVRARDACGRGTIWLGRWRRRLFVQLRSPRSE